VTFSNREKTAEDFVIDLAGILIAPTFPNHKTKKNQKHWFRYWEKLLTKSIKKNILVLRDSTEQQYKHFTH
jgi:hypothetical protein